MRKTRIKTTLLVLFGALSMNPAMAAVACSPLLDHRFQSLQGKPTDLCRYRGKVLLVVNTASDCGSRIAADSGGNRQACFR